MERLDSTIKKRDERSHALVEELSSRRTSMNHNLLPTLSSARGESPIDFIFLLEVLV